LLFPLTSWSEAYKKKVVPPTGLAEKVSFLKQQKQKIVTLNGSFDLMHAGHLHVIYEASRQADVLIVALNTDRSIQMYKGPKRPIVPLEYRIQMMAALEFVNFVTWFDETDPRQLLEVIQPQVHVNGSEYGADCIEAVTVKKNGGTLHIVQLIPGLSTSALMKKIQSEG